MTRTELVVARLLLLLALVGLVASAIGLGIKVIDIMVVLGMV